MDGAQGGVAAGELRRRLRYEADTGKLFWKSHSQRHMVGREAGHLRKHDGYIVVTLLGRSRFAHRLAWLLHYGRMPAEGMMIDHIDGDRANNRIVNLREASGSENMWNSRGNAGCAHRKGVIEDRRYPGTFYARICKDNVHHHLGTFRSEAEAHAAYVSAARAYFGEFARAQ